MENLKPNSPSHMITITVYGMPAPQGSKKHVGNGVMIESSKKVKPWRQDVSAAAVACGQQLPDGPVRVFMAFTLPKPKSAPKTRRTYPDRKPDLSKLVRSTEDALTTAAVWGDDARVVECTAAKRYPGEGADALDRPGAVIRIEAIV